MKTTNKHIITTLWVVCSMLLLFSSCVSETLLNNEEGLVKTRAFTDAPFYYYGYEDKEIFLEQIMNKIFIRFTSDTNKERMHALIGEVASLRMIDGDSWDKGLLRFATFESKDGKIIS